MKLKQKHGVLKSRPRVRRPYRVILHHTAGGSLSGAVSTLRKRGLGYHFMIDKKGVIHEYVPVSRKTFHAKYHNMGTVGIAFIGGGKYGGCNAAQFKACANLMKLIRHDYPSVTEFTGHKHVSRSGKIDPHWVGEPTNGVDWSIDHDHMKEMAKKSGLKPIMLRG